MADNLTALANTGAGTDVLATDEIGGVHYPRTKISIGADGSATDLSSTNPMPVSDAGGSLTVDGTVAVSGSVTVVDGGGSITVDGTVGISGAVPVTDNGGSLTVDGTVELGATTLAALESITVVDGGSSITVDGTVTAAVGTGATDLGKAEDSAHASGDVGVLSLAVRNDAAATSFTGANGDYSPIGVDAAGRVQVRMYGVASALDLMKLEDDPHASGDAGVMMLAIRNPAGTALTSADGDYSGIAVDGAGRPIIVGGAASGAAVSGNPVLIGGTDGTNARSVATDASGWLKVVSVNSIDVASVTDNAAFTDGTTKLLMPGYIYDEVAGTTPAENDAVAARVDVKRAQVLVIEDATTRGQRMAVSAAGAAATNLAQVAGNTMLTGAGATGTGSPRVTLASDSPGTTPIVAPRVSVTRPANTTAYAANDAWSSSTSSPANIEFTSMAKSAGKGGVLMTAMVSSSKASSLQFEVQLFDSAPTQVNDNSAFTVSDTDQLKKVGTFQGTLQAAGSSPNSEVTIALNLAYVCAATSLFAMVRVLSAYTPDNAEVLSIRLAAALGD